MTARTWLALLAAVAALAAGPACDHGAFDVGLDDDTGDDDTGDDDTGGGSCDPDPSTDTVPTSQECLEYNPYEIFDPDETVEWTWDSSALEPGSTDVMMAPIVISLTDDNLDGLVDTSDVPDVIFITFASGNYHDSGTLRAVSGADGSDLWAVTNAAYGVAPGAGIAAADIDNDGLPEIVTISDTGHPIAFDRAGNFLWESTHAVCRGYGYAAPAISDMDHDGTPEIVVGRAILDPGGVVLATGAYGCGNGWSFPADVDLDGVQEVVAGNTIYEIDGTAAAYNPSLGDGYTAVGDFDLDGDPEIVLTGTTTVQLLDHELNVLWTQTAAGTGSGGPPTVADYDGDGFPEVGVADLGKYAVYDTDDGAILWTNDTEDDSSSQTGSAVFDFNGDGVAEVVYADEHDLYVYQGTDGAILFDGVDHSSGTLFELPPVVDIDGDHSAEIVVASNDYTFAGSNGIMVLGAYEESWWPARGIWNQHAYHVTNIDDDGSVPQNETPVWQSYNGFRMQVPQYGWGGFEVPDVRPEATVCTETCPEVATVMLRVANEGTSGVLAGMPIDVALARGGTFSYDQTVYLPDAVDAGVLSGEIAIAVPGDAEAVRVTLDRGYDGGGVYTECDEDDNEVLLPGPLCAP